MLDVIQMLEDLVVTDVFYQGPKFYNTLNTDIVNSSSPFSIKKALKAFICNNY